MAYTPKTWQCGETIMADDLNHMEQGIAQGGAVEPLKFNVVETYSQTPNEHRFTINGMFAEILNAFDQGIPIILWFSNTSSSGTQIQSMLVQGVITDSDGGGIVIARGFDDVGGDLPEVWYYEAATGSSQPYVVETGK